MNPTDQSFFSPGTRIEGNLHVQGDIRLDGHIRGKVEGTSTVTVNSKAKIDANIQAPNIVVEGAVNGEIHAMERVVLQPTARVRGTLRSPKIRIDEGAVFEGECKMGAGEGAASS